MPTPSPLDRHSGFRQLNVFAFTSLLHLETIRFCDRYLTQEVDPTGRLYDQMTQAARSARANLMEMSEHNASSKEAEVKLLDSARASIVELMSDYESWLYRQHSTPWANTSEEAQAVLTWNPEEHDPWTDLYHDFGDFLLLQQECFQTWTNPDDISAANALFILCKRTASMLSRILQIKAEQIQESQRERRSSRRSESRSTEPSPECPLCGLPMRKTRPKTGPNAGNLIWSCTDFPNCRGLRTID